jgi:hypothetical protein
LGENWVATPRDDDEASLGQGFHTRSVQGNARAQ